MEEVDDGSEAAAARVWESGLGAILIDLLNLLIVLGGFRRVTGIVIQDTCSSYICIIKTDKPNELK